MLIPSGLEELDDVVQGLRLGDNVVWQVDDLQDYVTFASPFIERALQDGRQCVYLRFAPHEPIFEQRRGLEIVELDSHLGFDSFTAAVHEVVEDRGREVFYVFDSLSALAVEWATDELLANFFQVTCPLLFELDTVAYFGLARDKHLHQTVARIRETTQLLISVYRVEDAVYVHPLKVWDRYSPQMFLPHLVSAGEWLPLCSSGDAAEITSRARATPLDSGMTSCAPWETVYERLKEYTRAGARDDALTPEALALKQELCRMLIGGSSDFRELADRYLTIDDLFHVRERLVGSGRIGGKAAGMLLARRILEDDDEHDPPFSDILEAHDSFYIGSDVFFTYLVNNDLFRLRLQLVGDLGFSPEAFADVERRFLEGSFPPGIVEQFRSLVEYFGQAPIIVRSSSLLEDSFGNAFAGKYRSEFCPNQGSPEQRLAEFLRAVKLVYASALHPNVFSYRRKRGLQESDEQMAILVQRVSGQPFGGYFFPSLAGVALSRNLYVWTDRIDPSKGIMRLVFGLGTRAVERVGFDYPRMIPISNPRLRPEIGTKVAKYSQHRVDLLDLGANAFVTLPFSEVVAPGDYPLLHLLVSEMRDGAIYDPVTNQVRAEPADLVLTFNNLINQTKLAPIVGAVLAKLEKAYGRPVEIEFTACSKPDRDVRVNLLQCRPMWAEKAAAAVSYPHGLPEDRVLLRTSRFIGAGALRQIRYAVYIDAKAYAAIGSEEDKRSLAHAIGRINSCLRQADGQELIVGPGRFGSSNISLGVGVSYAEIDNAAVLVETAMGEGDGAPEVSYGTHFFQDLVEGQTIYLALDPRDKSHVFRREFFLESPSILADLVPDAAGLQDVVRVVDVCKATGGAYAELVADAERQQAICFLPAL